VSLGAQAAITRPGSAVRRRNPLAVLSAAMVLALVMVVVVDPVTPAVLLAIELVVLPAAGVRIPTLLRRAWALPIGAVSIGLSNAVFGDAPGPVLVAAGPLTISGPDALTGLALAVRVLAIALPGVAAASAVDPTDLADALIQQLGVSPRFAVGGLAGLRLLPVLSADWQTIGLARRARGLDAGYNPAAALHLFAGRTFAFLVAAIRRAVRLAGAMEARALDAGVPRTVLRVQRFGPADVLTVLGTALALAAALGASLGLGTLRLLFWGV
jgi:energy-coupling factor transport system permease protein